MDINDYKFLTNVLSEIRNNHIQRNKRKVILLIKFKDSIDGFNKKLHILIYHYNNDKGNTKKRKHDIEFIRLIFINMLNYISSWQLNIPQLVSRKMIHRKLGVLLAEEHAILEIGIRLLRVNNPLYHKNLLL